jgi:hypothetical protein
VWVNRREVIRSARLRMYDVIVPALQHEQDHGVQLALESWVAGGDKPGIAVPRRSPWQSDLASLRRSSVLVGGKARKLTDRVLAVSDQQVRQPREAGWSSLPLEERKQRASATKQDLVAALEDLSQYLGTTVR